MASLLVPDILFRCIKRCATILYYADPCLFDLCRRRYSRVLRFCTTTACMNSQFWLGRRHDQTHWYFGSGDIAQLAHYYFKGIRNVKPSRSQSTETMQACRVLRPAFGSLRRGRTTFRRSPRDVRGAGLRQTERCAEGKNILPLGSRHRTLSYVAPTLPS